jgi:hypothetical protein
MKYIVYAIGKLEDLIEPYDKCYIGVTIDAKRRWNLHNVSKYKVGLYIKEHNLDSSNMVAIFRGTEQECYDLEYKYRPYPNIGLNVAAGGEGGHTGKYTLERNKKISLANKGKKKNPASVERMKATKLKNGVARGSKNGMAKKWILTDPSGNIILVNGNLQQVCDENKILRACLKRYIGVVVPAIKKIKNGGYIAKSEKSLVYRNNTTGWMLNMNKEE